MEYLASQETINFLWSALNENRSHRQTKQMRYYFDKFIKDKWAFRTDLEDALDYADSRINPNRIEILDLIKAFGINVELICYRERIRSNKGRRRGRYVYLNGTNWIQHRSRLFGRCAIAGN